MNTIKSQASQLSISSQLDTLKYQTRLQNLIRLKQTKSFLTFNKFIILYYLICVLIVASVIGINSIIDQYKYKTLITQKIVKNNNQAFLNITIGPTKNTDFKCEIFLILNKKMDKNITYLNQNAKLSLYHIQKVNNSQSSSKNYSQQIKLKSQLQIMLKQKILFSEQIQQFNLSLGKTSFQQEKNYLLKLQFQEMDQLQNFQSVYLAIKIVSEQYFTFEMIFRLTFSIINLIAFLKYVKNLFQSINIIRSEVQQILILNSLLLIFFSNPFYGLIFNQNKNKMIYMWIAFVFLFTYSIIIQYMTFFEKLFSKIKKQYTYIYLGPLITILMYLIFKTFHQPLQKQKIIRNQNFIIQYMNNTEFFISFIILFIYGLHFISYLGFTIGQTKEEVQKVSRQKTKQRTFYLSISFNMIIQLILCFFLNLSQTSSKFQMIQLGLISFYFHSLMFAYSYIIKQAFVQYPSIETINIEMKQEQIINKQKIKSKKIKYLGTQQNQNQSSQMDTTDIRLKKPIM